MEAAGCSLSMPQYKVEYRECPKGAVLTSSFITASNAEEAETAVKREFTAVQANLGARQYDILDSAAAVVATHSTPADPPRENL
jgi:hypothetical protein